MLNSCSVNNLRTIMATRSDLDYSQRPQYQTDIRDYFSEFISPRQIHDDNTSCVLELPNSAFSTAFDECILWVKYKIEKKGAAGTYVPLEHTDTDGNPGIDSTVAPINNILESLFTQYDVSINQKIVSDSSGMYPYTAYLIKLLNYSSDAKDSYLTLSGYHRETTANVNDHTDDNMGWKMRRDRILNSKEDLVAGVLYSDIAYAQSQLPSHTDITLVLHKNKPEHLIQGGRLTINYRLSITNVELEVRKYELSPRLNLSIEKQLATMGTIPFKHLSTTNHFIPVGSSSFQINRLVLGQLPLRLVFGIVTNKTFAGDVRTSPFDFRRHGLIEYQLSIDGKVYPQRAVNCVDYVEPYLNLFRSTGQFCTNQTSGITFEQFKGSYCLHVINLRGDQDSRTDIYPARSQGTTSLRLTFERATTEGLTVICLAEFENVYSVDKLRNFSSDHSVH